MPRVLHHVLSAHWKPHFYHFVLTGHWHIYACLISSSTTDKWDPLFFVFSFQLIAHRRTFFSSIHRCNKWNYVILLLSIFLPCRCVAIVKMIENNNNNDDDNIRYMCLYTECFFIKVESKVNEVTFSLCPHHPCYYWPFKSRPTLLKWSNPLCSHGLNLCQWVWMFVHVSVTKLSFFLEQVCIQLFFQFLIPLLLSLESFPHPP